MLRRFSTLLGKSLVLAESHGRRVVPSTLNAITAAARCGPVTALVVGSTPEDTSAVAAALSKTDGVSHVLVSTASHYDHAMPEELSPLVVQLVHSNDFSHVFAAASAFGKNLIPRVAAVLNVMPISEVVDMEGEDVFVRNTYAGNAVITIQSSDKIKCVTVRSTSFAAATSGTTSTATRTDVPPTTAQGKSKWVQDDVATSDKVDFSTAKTVISGGRGLKNGENFKLLQDLATPLKGAVGATRAVVDAGYVPNDMQIGQTGKIVAPALYIAVGLSGAIQHVAGMKDSKTIVAINSDPDAPIFQVADYGLVADLFDAVPKLTSMIKGQ